MQVKLDLNGFSSTTSIKPTFSYRLACSRPTFSDRPSCNRTPAKRSLICLACSRPTFSNRPSCNRTPAKRSLICLAQKPPLLEVTLHEATLVKPSTVSYSDDPSNYFLSNLDLFMQPITVQLVLFFAPKDRIRHISTHNPADILKEALKNVLAHYYPLAGRLALDNHGRPSIHCNGEGVYFVDADANVELSDLGDLTLPNIDTFGHLVYPFHLTIGTRPLLTTQVTKFKCGGFALGVVFAHCVCDGTAFANFMISWGETACGVPLSLPPVLDRTFLKARSPLQIQYSHGEYDFAKLECPSTIPTAHNDYTLRSYRFTPASLAVLRKRALEDGVLSSCTPFEALTGLLWKARTTAMGTESKQRVKLSIGFDGRFVRGARFPRGYFGNGVTSLVTATSAGEIIGNPLSHVVKHVQRAVKCATGEYIRSQIDYLEREGVSFLPYADTYMTTDWSRLYHLNKRADFGWGMPIQVQPASIIAPELSIILAYGEGGKGMNVVLCHSPKILERMDELINPHLDLVQSFIS